MQDGNIRHALVMAAGRGTRMRPLTDVLPKAMAPFLGKTLIEAGIKMIKEQVEFVHVTVGYKSSMLAQHLMQIGVASIMNTEGYPNNWWICNTLFCNLDEPVYVLTCDNVIQLDFELLTRNYFDLGAPACMIVPVLPVKGLEGDYIEHIGQRVVSIDRHKESDVYCSGIQIMNPHLVADITNEADSFYDVWKQLINLKQLWISSIYPKKWFAVDTMDQLHQIGQEYDKIQS